MSGECLCSILSFYFSDCFSAALCITVCSTANALDAFLHCKVPCPGFNKLGYCAYVLIRLQLGSLEIFN
ncbi:hypothetical protein PF005_g31970 [Phytophthora fragariae]|uniref:Secreted protein n=1 Tax=Phytophthora fragariae TaxID=53985 RepID=A0A6A4AXB4_9STRA|nr:hypothetical protein PF003_g19391 [Phytophthora fragariae]KAE8917529.1 hypothetical protein PF009_g32149 [Phytophthora fragariae]KAE8956225.1 hypothetical protein PF011_g31553 [Phytophthora fragariae]KAE9057450.1 hypothetical protein PF010_g31378 [Phytophthora fragariae]KAE9060586.1 hypothetical protein PF006_g31609 [Phytophthora fragariae]